MKKILILAIIAFIPSLASAATLSVSPSSKSVNVGETFSVTINLDTQGASVDGVDLRYLNYNPALLQVQDGNTAVNGVQIAPGKLMSATLLNSVNANTGKISFSQVNAGGTKYSGSGVPATVTFKALATGNAGLTFDYVLNKTTDSNVASVGKDILNAVVNGSFTIKGTSAQAPTKTVTTTNTGGTGTAAPATEDTTLLGTDTETTDGGVTGSIPRRTFFGSIANMFINIISRIKNGFMSIF